MPRCGLELHREKYRSHLYTQRVAPEVFVRTAFVGTAFLNRQTAKIETLCRGGGADIGGNGTKSPAEAGKVPDTPA